jgi:hypothetical protein
MWENTWFVGIVGGIISGLMVFYITNWISSKVNKKEYFKKVVNANNEVVYVLRQAISEGEFPDANIIDSIIKATGRKYFVNVKDMYAGSAIIENLVKEVFDTSFISTDIKIESSKRLLEIKNTYDMYEIGTDIDNIIKSRMEKDKTLDLMTSVIMPISFLLVLLALYTFNKSTLESKLIGSGSEDFLKMIMILFTSFTVAVVSLLLARIKSRSRERLESEKKEDVR